MRGAWVRALSLNSALDLDLAPSTPALSADGKRSLGAEATARKTELEEKYQARRNALPGALKKLTNGYELRVHWFEVFECVRKILLIGIPVFFPPDSPEQLTLGLIICFITFGAYMMYAPFEDSGDDLLSQICQFQVPLFYTAALSRVIMTLDAPLQLCCLLT